MRERISFIAIFLGMTVVVCAVPASVAQTQAQPQQQRTRRSQRVRMQEVQVASPDGKLKFMIMPNAERLTYTVTVGSTTVIELSPMVMKMDGYDLSAGVVFSNLEWYEVNETYAWYGAHSTAVNQCHGVKVSLVHDLSFINYTLEVRVFNDGVAFRHVIPGEEKESHVPDEYSSFIIPNGSKV